jgi:hypothetical protein
VRREQARAWAKHLSSTMSCNVIPFFLRNVASYRMWLNKTSDPRVLRDVGLCACDDLEEALTVIDEHPENSEPEHPTAHIDARRQ